MTSALTALVCLVKARLTTLVDFYSVRLDPV